VSEIEWKGGRHLLGELSAIAAIDQHRTMRALPTRYCRCTLVLRTAGPDRSRRLSVMKLSGSKRPDAGRRNARTAFPAAAAGPAPCQLIDETAPIERFVIWHGDSEIVLVERLVSS
jgi:hypothetical protein